MDNIDIMDMKQSRKIASKLTVFTVFTAFTGNKFLPLKKENKLEFALLVVKRTKELLSLSGSFFG